MVEMVLKGDRAGMLRAVMALLVLACACAAAIGLPAAATGSSTSSGAEARAIPGQLIVSFDERSSRGERAGALAAAAAKAKPLGTPGIKLVEVAVGSTGAAADALEGLPGVEYAEPNYVRTQRADQHPRKRRSAADDPYFSELWGVRTIRAPSVWSRHTRGSSEVTIAVADDGVDVVHPDLAGNIWRNPGETGAGRETNGRDDDHNGLVDDWRGWDFAAGDNDPSPDHAGRRPAEHGTHVAGIIGADGNNRVGVTGVNWDVSVMPLRIFNRNGITTTAKIVKAFAYAAENGARAVNASFGGENHSQAEHDVISGSPGTLFVVSAPNDPVDIDRRTDYPCGYELANIICVTASDRARELAGFAAQGRSTIDLAAPGSDILSTVPGGYETMTGTSMAAPHVSGAIGLIAAARPGASSKQIRSALVSSARGKHRIRRFVGAGSLDALRATSRVLGKAPR